MGWRETLIQEWERKRKEAKTREKKQKTCKHKNVKTVCTDFHRRPRGS